MSSKILPSVFVSHGAPSLAIEQNDTVTFLRKLGGELGRPRAILCISAHWQTSLPTVSAATDPETIHDFRGFPETLYQIRYSPPGAQEVAGRVADLLKVAGIEYRVSPDRGLDHGAWIPLSLMYPEADIPVTQLSVQPLLGPAAHFRIGQLLAPLRRKGVLVLATGGATHNLALIGDNNIVPTWARQFDNWLHERITSGKYEEAVNYRRLASHSEIAHPTEEHILPLFVAMGAGTDGGKQQARRLHHGWTHGSLSMAAYSFGEVRGGDRNRTDE